MTPEEYMQNNPEAVLVYRGNGNYDYAIHRHNAHFCRYKVDRCDWRAYTEPHIYGPDVPMSKQRELRWGPWLLREPGSKPSPGNDVSELQSVSLPDGWTAYRYGDYVDAPAENLAPELSRFLPEGWEWVWDCDRPYVKDNQGISYCPSWHKDLWHSSGLLHPDEGGGFQFGPCPSGARSIDLIEGVNGKKAWRPHYRTDVPKLSRSLPDGWKWKRNERGVGWGVIGTGVHLDPRMPKACWHARGRLTPSEGGGFQKHVPGDPMPCDGITAVDVIYENNAQMDGAWAANCYWGKDQLEGKYRVIEWRPHVKKAEQQTKENEMCEKINAEADRTDERGSAKSLVVRRKDDEIQTHERQGNP